MRTTMFVLIAAVTLEVAALAQPASQGKPSPFGVRREARQTEEGERLEPAPRSSSPGRAGDLFPEKFAAAQRAEVEWRRQDEALDDRPDGCGAEDRGAIEQTAFTKQRSLAQFADYYQSQQSFWRKVRDSSSEMERSRRTDRTELAALLQTVENELADVQRRKDDLQQALREKNIAPDQKAWRELEALEAKKTEEVEKHGEILRLFDEGQVHLQSRREQAIARMAELQELLQSIKTETFLWEHLYKGMLYRFDVRCEGAIPRPGEFDRNAWRERIQQRGAGSVRRDQ